MNGISFEVLLEKFGAKAVISAVFVCLITAIIKKTNKGLTRKVLTMTEVALSFAIAALCALIANGGDMSEIISDGLSTAGVALTVCGMICTSDENPVEPSEDDDDTEDDVRQDKE